MLGGIRTLKRKRKNHKASASASSPAPEQRPAANLEGKHANVIADIDNKSAADELRKAFGSGPPVDDDCHRSIVDAGQTYNRVDEGRLNRVLSKVDACAPDSTGDAIILSGKGVAAPLCKEDFRRGARRGKLKRARVGEGDGEGEHDYTLEQLVEEEKREKCGVDGAGGMSMDEVYARNVARLGSRYKGMDRKRDVGSLAGADEEDFAGDGGVDATMYALQSNKLTAAAALEREKSRRVAVFDKQQKIAQKCFWWMESVGFAKHMLLALGDHLSLVLAPTHKSLTEHQCYLVPVKHAASFSACEDEVWEELARFQSSLRKMFAKDMHGVLFMETVLPNSGFWQARMDVIPVPKTVEQDAPIHFKSALTEQAEEWGTHTKLMPTGSKGLRRTVPKSFPYFYVEWQKNSGYAQIIESSSFPRDFGADTIAGMMRMDPVRFNRKRRARDADRSAVLKFCSKWKEFDWTLELDD